MAGKYTWTLLVLAALISSGHGNIVHRNQRKIGERCHNPADIVFVLDESGSIWGPHFEKQLQFVVEVINSFNVNFNETHIGVETFATSPRDIFVLGQYLGAEQLSREVMKIKQGRGGTRTFDALERMRDVQFNSAYTRDWVPHIGIVITDGESEDNEATIQQADASKKAGISLFAVGVGHSIKHSELAAIASSPDQVFTVTSYDILDKLKEQLAWKACQVTTLPPPTTTTTTTTPAPTTTTPPPQMIEDCNGHTAMDIVFSVPDQAGIIDTKYYLEFIGEVVDEFKLGPDRVQTGLTPRYCDDAEGIHLREYDSKKGFTRALEERLLQSGTRTDWQLEYLVEEAFLPDNGAREESIKYGVLILDNSSHDLEETLRVADLAKAQGIRLIVIGVGSFVPDTELSQIASSDDAWLHVNSYEQLLELQGELINKLCEGLEEIPRGDVFSRREYEY